MRTSSGFALVVYIFCAARFAARGDANGPQTAPYGLVHIVTYDPFRSVADKERGITERSHWSLWLIEGSLRFLTDGATRRPAPDSPELPGDATSHLTNLFTVDRATLRFFVSDDSLKLKDLEAKQDWYLTGDYSTDPPGVILTKEPTKYSQWKFIDPDPAVFEENGSVCYIRNENDKNKDEWLHFEDKGIVFKHGQELRKPVLSRDKKVRYFLETFPGGR